ncbi:SLAP domain-containing protein [Anoxybacteroides tepidamans]|uniref:SLAP domain-containing protein n=1 Tax=Anoxybacteroides tepidamans TaxID=265948 RepID=UPI000686B4B4|nr:SLAP domain-containing protein [Anoxybacillus tepidamans]
MIKKWLTCLVIAFIVAVGSFGQSGQTAEAKTLWGNLELKKGMIGKIVIVKDAPLYEWKQNKMNAVRTLKKGQQYRVYSSKIVQGSLFYSLGGGLYVKKAANVQYVPLSPEQFTLLIKQSLKGDYELVSGKEHVSFFIEKQRGNELSGWYFFTENDPLPVEGTIDGNVVTLRVYFDDYYDQILETISYLEQYKVPKSEIEDIAEQLVNNDDYYIQFQFTVANDPSNFKGELRFVGLLLDDRYDVVGTELGNPFPVQIEKLD